MSLGCPVCSGGWRLLALSRCAPASVPLVLEVDVGQRQRVVGASCCRRSRRAWLTTVVRSAAAGVPKLRPSTAGHADHAAAWWTHRSADVRLSAMRRLADGSCRRANRSSRPVLLRILLESGQVYFKSIVVSLLPRRAHATHAVGAIGGGRAASFAACEGSGQSPPA